ncbi:MAG TPA: hypothetical protein VM030_02385 [Acidimicrobiales bacterium]|nr:hypothetical protein [Acidimicrobiales bacterium]
MFGERQRPERIRAEQSRALRRSLRREVLPFSEFYRRRAESSDHGRRVDGIDDLPRLALTDLEEIADPAQLVLRPDPVTIARYGPRLMAVRAMWARLWGRQDTFGHSHIDPVYKPVHWVMAGSVPIGCTAADLDRLAELGRRALEGAGLRPSDVLVTVTPPRPTIGFTQLSSGARRAGISALHLGALPSTGELRHLRPTVLAGRPSDLLSVARAASDAGLPLEGVHTLLAIEDRLDHVTRADLERYVPGAVVVAMWAPPGVRAHWVECRGGDGLHTWPAAEVVEVVDATTRRPVTPGDTGEIVWTAVGWRGTCLIRLRTHVSGRMEEAACPTCGRTSARLQLLPPPPPLHQLLDERTEVRAWQAELRTVDGLDELLVYLSLRDDKALSAVVDAVDRRVNATQYVLLSPDAMADRLASASGNQLIDLRV